MELWFIFNIESESQNTSAIKGSMGVSQLGSVLIKSDQH